MRYGGGLFDLFGNNLQQSIVILKKKQTQLQILRNSQSNSLSMKINSLIMKINNILKYLNNNNINSVSDEINELDGIDINNNTLQEIEIIIDNIMSKLEPSQGSPGSYQGSYQGSPGFSQGSPGFSQGSPGFSQGYQRFPRQDYPLY